MSASTPRLHDLDPFDLPEWLGTTSVTWHAEAGIRAGSRIPGHLRGSGAQDAPLGCDLLAVDLAYPAPTVADDVRVRAHRAWQHGQLLLVADASEPTRVLLAVPGSGFTADLVLDAFARLASAVGAAADDFVVQLRIGTERR